MRNSPRIASRNFLGMLLTAAMSATRDGWPGGLPARWIIAFSPYLPLLVSIATAYAPRRRSADALAPCHDLFDKIYTICVQRLCGYGVTDLPTAPSGSRGRSPKRSARTQSSAGKPAFVSAA